MPFSFRRISRHGTSNPIVARLSVQTSELLKFSRITEDQRDAVFRSLFEGVQPRLLECLEIVESLRREVNEATDQIAREGIKSQSGGRAVHLPSILRLRERSESFLYNAKSALRDLAGILEPLFDKRFGGAQYQKVLAWARNRFGDKSPIALLLAEDQGWIKTVVDMRNAVEHPGGDAGTLHLEDFAVVNGSGVLLPPTWHLNDNPASKIVEDMEILLSNMLHFTEDLLVLSLQQFEAIGPIAIVEIPEDQRSRECPIRLRAVIDPSKVKRSDPSAEQ